LLEAISLLEEEGNEKNISFLHGYSFMATAPSMMRAHAHAHCSIQSIHCHDINRFIAVPSRVLDGYSFLFCLALYESMGAVVAALCQKRRCFEDDEHASYHSFSNVVLPPLGARSSSHLNLQRNIISPYDPRYQYVSQYFI
jgi:hypothetical protein